MASQPKKPLPPHFEELKRLFYLYRIAQLNCRYYCARGDKFGWWERSLQAVVALSTAASFGILVAFQASWIKPFAAILSLLALLASAVLPRFAIGHKIEELRDRELAWSGAVGQLENAMRFTKAHPHADGEITGYVHATEEMYNRAVALHAENPDEALVGKLTEGIRRAFPPDYVWTAF
jgi:hypothetical protein